VVAQAEGMPLALLLPVQLYQLAAATHSREQGQVHVQSQDSLKCCYTRAHCRELQQQHATNMCSAEH
jgi:hypothetical protein